MKLWLGKILFDLLVPFINGYLKNEVSKIRASMEADNQQMMLNQQKIIIEVQEQSSNQRKGMEQVETHHKELVSAIHKIAFVIQDK